MRQRKLRILRTGDENSAFNTLNPQEILDRFGLPSYLLGSSAKLEKCKSKRVLARVLYLTPGIFCPLATDGCRGCCLGHTSGRMGLQDQTTARDKRAALYLEEPDYFLARLKSELYLLQADAMRLKCRPAVRLNGSSDIAWEQRHPEIFDEFPQIQFYDYTKIPTRVHRFLGIGKRSQRSWPRNYHLTFSADERTTKQAKRILKHGGTVTVVFWPELPATWCGFPVVDGDTHDARFLDPQGSVIGLRAKGTAKDDDSGFVFRWSA
jgi:hypothetical protein